MMSISAIVNDTARSAVQIVLNMGNVYSLIFAVGYQQQRALVDGNILVC